MHDEELTEVKEAFYDSGDSWEAYQKTKSKMLKNIMHIVNEHKDYPDYQNGSDFLLHRPKIKPFHSEQFEKKCRQIISLIPFNEVSDAFITYLTSYGYLEECKDFIKYEEYQLNSGNTIRAYNRDPESFQYEQWCNVISTLNYEDISFSLHLRCTIDEFHLDLKNKCMAVILNISEKQANSSDYSSSYGPSKYLTFINSLQAFYLSVHDYSQDTEDTFSLTKRGLNEYYYELFKYDNRAGKYSTIKEKIWHKDQSMQRVERQCTKSETEYGYHEENFEKYSINGNSSFGNKMYSNSAQRVYHEDWWRSEFDNGHELTIRRDLDDGLGCKTNELLGHKIENNEKIYEFHDITYECVPTGEITTFKFGDDSVNQWNSKIRTKRNHEFNHVENYGKNRKSCDEWYETWYNCNSENYCFKWGKNGYEEWEEEWKEQVFDDAASKICYKKCKKFFEVREWFETWNERNQGNETIEKTCYKMNKDANGKTEKFWGDVMVSPSENNWLHYVGYSRNGEESTYMNYSKSKYPLA